MLFREKVQIIVNLSIIILKIIINNKRLLLNVLLIIVKVNVKDGI